MSERITCYGREPIANDPYMSGAWYIYYLWLHPLVSSALPLVSRALRGGRMGEKSRGGWRQLSSSSHGWGGKHFFPLGGRHSISLNATFVPS